MKLLVALMLTAITMAPAVAQTVKHDQHTGNTLITSQRVSVNNGLFNNLNAYGIYSTKAGFGVGVEYMGTGGNWMFFQEAWSFGQRLKFTAASGSVMGCGAGCTLLEGGFIHLTETAFRKAANEGFGFKLLGPGGSVEGSVPASTFASVLAKL